MIKADEESTIRSTAEAVFFGPEAALRGPMQLNLYLKNVRRVR